jgi:hypothetical protein
MIGIASALYFVRPGYGGVVDVDVFLLVVLRSRPLSASDSSACRNLLYCKPRQCFARGMMEEGSTIDGSTADPFPMLSRRAAGELAKT